MSDVEVAFMLGFLFAWALARSSSRAPVGVVDGSKPETPRPRKP